MPSEDFIVNDPNDVVVIIFISVFQVFKDFQLNTCLVLKSFLVADNFNGYHLLLFVVKTFESLPKAATANLVKNFIPKSKMVFYNDLVISTLVIITEIVAILG